MSTFFLMLSLPEQLMESVSFICKSEESNCLIKHLEIRLIPFLSSIAQMSEEYCLKVLF